jgi:hypothetical protein
METDKPGKVFIDSLSIRHVRKKRIFYVPLLMGLIIAAIYDLLLGIKLLFAQHN